MSCTDGSKGGKSGAVQPTRVLALWVSIYGGMKQENGSPVSTALHLCRELGKGVNELLVLEAFRITCSEIVFVQEHVHPSFIGRRCTTFHTSHLPGSQKILPSYREAEGLKPLPSSPARSVKKLRISSILPHLLCGWINLVTECSVKAGGSQGGKSETQEARPPVTLLARSHPAPSCIAAVRARRAELSLPRAACHLHSFQLVWCSVYLVGVQVTGIAQES